MSDFEPTTEHPTVLTDEPTAALRVPGSDGPDTEAQPAIGYDEFDDDEEDYEDEDDLWPSEPVKTMRMRTPTAILCGLVLLAGGFFLGVTLQKGRGSSASASSLAARFRAAAAGASGTSGTAGFTRSTAAASGIVTAIQGNNLYVTNTAGDLVQVELTPNTTYTRNATATASSIAPGDTVVVQGAKEKNGSVLAASVAATQAGLSRGGGGGSPFARGGG